MLKNAHIREIPENANCPIVTENRSAAAQGGAPDRGVGGEEKTVERGKEALGGIDRVIILIMVKADYKYQNLENCMLKSMSVDYVSI